MPITITPAQPIDLLGPGLRVHAVTDFSGAIGATWRYVFTYTLDDTPTISNTISSFSVPSFGINTVDYVLYGEGAGIRSGDKQIASGTTAFLTVELVDNVAAVQDTGQINRAWNDTAGLGLLSNLNITPPVSSTFTATDRANMSAGFANTLDALTATITNSSGVTTQTLAQIFSRSTLDTLTLEELTTGPTGSPVHALIGAFYYGVIVRITTIPYNLEPVTPDQDWYLPDLAVLRVFRGNDLEYRRGIHSSTWLAPSPWKFGAEILNIASLLGSIVPDTHVFVDFKPGVEGQVFLMNLP